MIFNRQSHRLKNYDYGQRGLYFLTICCQNRENMFGYIADKTMFLNDAGKMIEKWYEEIHGKFPNINCLDYVVMPNHFHCILHVSEKRDNVIGDVVRWFKTMTTNDYIKGVKTNGWKRFDQKLWQRDYYDSIIRDSDMHANITDYIKNNPAKWIDDKFYFSDSFISSAMS
jgi:REP element-mobilizing transposase RayT